MDKDERIKELENDCKRLAAELDYIGVADEELMYPDLYKSYLREPVQSLKTRPPETIVMQPEKPTKDELFRQKQEAMSDAELAESARNEISKMCKTGGRSITMCVPPMVTDTDMILCELIRRFKKLSGVA